MTKTFFLFGILCIMSSAGYSQVGINTENPSASLHVAACKTDGTTPEGIITPRLTREHVIGKDAQYTEPQTGAIIYVTDLSGNVTAKTVKITQIGYYYFDGTLWQSFKSASSPWYKVGTLFSSTLNVDDSYLTSKVVIGGNIIGSTTGTDADAQLTVIGGDASINGVTVGKGQGIGVENTVVGSLALANNTTGNENVAIGSLSFQHLVDGSRNVGIGRSVAQNITEGNNNIAIGYQAGSNITTGSNNLVIGANTTVPSPTVSNQMNIANTLYGTAMGTPNAKIGVSALSIIEPTENLDVNGSVRVRQLPLNGSSNTVQTKSDGSGSSSRDQPFSATKTVVVDNNGVLGIINGLPITEIPSPDIRTIQYATQSAIIDANLRQNSVTSIGNLAVYFEAQTGDTGERPVRFCLLNGITDNVVVNQMKLGSGGGTYGNNQTFLGLVANPAEDLISNIPSYNSNDVSVWNPITQLRPNIGNRDYIQYMISLINTREIYRLTAIVNGNIAATSSVPSSPAQVTFFIERLSNQSQ